MNVAQVNVCGELYAQLPQLMGNLLYTQNLRLNIELTPFYCVSPSYNTHTLRILVYHWLLFSFG